MPTFNEFDQESVAALESICWGSRPRILKSGVIKTGVTTIIPLDILVIETSATSILNFGAEGAGKGDGAGRVFGVEIPDDMAGRDPYDKTTAFAALTIIGIVEWTQIPELGMTVGYANTAADLTAVPDGTYLIMDGAGKLKEAATPANTTADVFDAHTWILLKGITTSIALVAYVGLMSHDNS